ncbi:HK97 gp10 family phage protein [Micrococcus sp.]|uniref:HK97 gp10 family phage protein n=1 Tax=Micrococcus sp. TaxID=1271 RepID=UPI002A91E397|nr:HK97 gp10 family phage protein [Micrococcus sp.]MDY6054346.1 HK97 gp10 family phage protein [Micrococcus sp.]
MKGAHELDALARDLGKMPAEVARKVGPIARKTALEIKRGMQADLAKSRHFGQVARSVDYDVHESGAFGSQTVLVEVGPNADRHPAAALAGLAYFGGANGGGGTVRDPVYHLEEQAALMEKCIGDLTGEGL